MASIFANNRILPNLKRRANKSDAPSPSKSKLLHILPNVAEEDEAPSRHSCSSVSSLPAETRQPSRFVAASATLGARPTHDKHDSRRVVLTGIEGLTFDDFFPPSSAPRLRTPSPPPRTHTPSPPPRPLTPPRSVASSSSSGSQSPLNDLNLRFSGLGISLDFPSPPSSAAHLSTLSRRREQSPAPSFASSDTSTSSPQTPCSTPPSSDDDESPSKSNLMRAPTFKSQRASILFIKSVPDLAEPLRKSSISSFIEDDISEQVDWIAHQVSDIVTLSTPLAPAFPLGSSEQSLDARARPDSIVPPPQRQSADRNRPSKPLPVLPRISIQDTGAKGPSAQLDPTFPLKRRSYMVPSRPPPPPPMPKSPTMSIMEQATEDLLTELANAALGAGFLGTELTVPSDLWSSAGSAPASPSSQFIVMTPAAARPPPRSSVPADIFDICDESESPIEFALPRHDTWPTTPQSTGTSACSHYAASSSSSPPASPLSSFDFNVDMPFAPDSHISRRAAPEPESPTPLRRSPSTLSTDPERTLRSRWSTSTLGSLAGAESHSHSWLPRFTLSPSKKAKASKLAHAAPVPLPAPSAVASPLQRKNAVKGVHAPKRSVDSDYALGRHDSRSSRVSESSASDSGESTVSAGLRRKPIPMMLMLSASGSGSQHF